MLPVLVILPLGSLGACGSSSSSQASLTVDTPPSYTGSQITIPGDQLKASLGSHGTTVALPYRSGSYPVHKGETISVKVTSSLPPISSTEAVAAPPIRCTITVGGKAVATNTGVDACSARYTVR